MARSGLCHGQTNADLPPPDMIDWIMAAGNYVEVHAGSRLLLRRLTMRQVEALLGTQGFVRIHRSTIVNRERIREWDGSRTLLLRDNTPLRVGDAYRRNLGRLSGRTFVT